MVDPTFPSNPPTRPKAEKVITDVETLKVFSDAMRRRIMRTMTTEPRTVQHIAEELNVPFTRLYYHIKMLERHGLIQVVETRTLSGAVEEKFYQVTARNFTVDRRLLTLFPEDLDRAPVEDMLGNILDETQRYIRLGLESGAIDVKSLPPAQNALFLQSKRIRLSAEKALAFYQKLDELLQLFVESEDTDVDNVYTLVLGFYPTSDEEIDH